MTKAHSITYLRDTEGAYGFICSCAHEYRAPTSAAQSPSSRDNLVDSMIRYHEAKHKKKR